MAENEKKAVITITLVEGASKDNVKIEFSGGGVPVEAIIVALDIIQDKLKEQQDQKIQANPVKRTDIN